MEKVSKSNNFECRTPSSEFFLDSTTQNGTINTDTDYLKGGGMNPVAL
jgi:hypothetical protein